MLALAAAVILPLLLESDPKPLGDDVSIQIPPIDNGKFVTPLVARQGQNKPRLLRAGAGTDAKPSAAVAPEAIAAAERRMLGQPAAAPPSAPPLRARRARRPRRLRRDATGGEMPAPRPPPNPRRRAQRPPEPCACAASGGCRGAGRRIRRCQGGRRARGRSSSRPDFRLTSRRCRRPGAGAARARRPLCDARSCRCALAKLKAAGYDGAMVTTANDRIRLRRHRHRRLSTVFAFARGFVRVVMSLAAWVVALVAAFQSVAVVRRDAAGAERHAARALHRWRSR